MTQVNPASPTIRSESLWPRLAEVSLPSFEGCEYERLHAVLAYEFDRVTTQVRLVGRGADGLGEDVSVFREDGNTLHRDGALAAARGRVDAGRILQPPHFPRAVAGASGVGRGAALSQLGIRVGGARPRAAPGGPLAARRTGAGAATGALCNSLGLGKEPSIEPVRRRLVRFPGMRFKLDAEATWAPALVEEVAATGAVDTIDFKGHYGFEVSDREALGALYDQVLAAFPDAYLEDPHDLPEVAQRLGDHLARVSYDSPIRNADDIGATPLAARVVNVKPSRIGGLRPLFDVYARCERERRPMYGGGMGELGVGRGQIELLAALFAPMPQTTWRRAPITRTIPR